MQPETQLARVRHRMQEVTRELEALDAMKRPSRRDLLRMAQLNEELAWLIVEEGLAGGDECHAKPEAGKVIPIKAAGHV